MASVHAKSFFQTTIGNHPAATAIVLAILVVLILVLGFYVSHYKAKCKDRFLIAPISNLTTGNNNPQWQYGAMDAGNWGPVHRDATAWNVAAYHPGWRTGNYRRASMEQAAASKEGMTSGARVAAYGPCGLGETPVSYQTPDGANVTFCRSTSAPPGPPQVCGVGWDPAASAEAEALATIGSLQHDSYGEPRLQNAINAAYDSSVGLSDEQLSTLMHQGGTP
jgi:hypothetical protein